MVRPFYEKAGIPMVNDDRARKRILKLLDANKKLRSIPIARRSSEKAVGLLDEMKNMLDPRSHYGLQVQKS
ncbi:Hypothetical protein FKW44_014647 [Caligus rogercresseyi]|uniref:Uncharacterized protein n=1 Tax=Caligus rogercresseyi TaxID=217165 RepID=A0A7T8H023_CALRO|nr:Hypothetical protein FKW44_014647 [Caligus rogercresseyi]